MKYLSTIINLSFIVSLVCSLTFGQVQTEEYTPDANTVLLLHLNETVGSIANDESQYSNHAVISSNQPAEGKFFGGRTFPNNNTDVGILLPRTSSLDIKFPNPITIEAWIKADLHFQGGTSIVKLNEYVLQLGSFGSSGYLQFSRREGDVSANHQTTSQIPLNEWIHIAGVWDGSEARIYVNGVSQPFNTTVSSNPFTQNTEFRVASFKGSIVPVDVNYLIDEVRISNIARTPQSTPFLPFSDDFTGGPNPAWEVFGDYWSFSNDKVYSNVNPTYIYQYIIVGDNSWQDYTFEVDVLGTSGTDKAICFRVQDTQNFYMLHLIGPIQYHHIELYRYVDGHYTVIYQNPNYSVQNNVNYHLKVETYGDNIRIYINGNFEAEVTDDTFSSGGVALAGGWNGYAPCYVEFDNVSVQNEQGSGDLVAYYPFNGNAHDESGNGNDGNVFGASLTADRFGNLNSAYSFDGINDYLLVPDDDDLRFGTTDFTIDVWAKCSFINKKRTLIEKRIGNAEYLIDVRLDGTIRGAIVDAANNNVVIYSTTVITDDRWHHIALVRDVQSSDLLKLYIDGVLEVEGSYPTILDVSSTGDITFGRDIVFDRYFDGVMDDIHLYNRALTEAEILELYGGFNGGLVAHYPFNGNANDESGNGNDGNVIGASLADDRCGNPNSSYYFDGVDDEIVLGSEAFSFVNHSYSISVWAWWDKESNLGTHILDKQGYPVNGGGGYRLYTGATTDGKIIFAVSTEVYGTGYVEYNTQVIPDVNTWYHIVVNSDVTGSTTVYINGEAKVTDMTEPLIGNPFELKLGRRIDFNGSRFKGIIDDVRIYNTTLTESEILDLYSECNDGLVAYYPFNGNANDESGNGWNCDVFGATLTDDRFGNIGYAYEFDGVNDYIFTQNELDWESLGLHNTMSISVWLEPYSLGLDNSQYYPGWALNNRDLDNATYWTVGFGGYHTSDQKGAFTVFNDNYQSNSILKFNQWYHLVAVLENASTVKIYINGILENSYSITTPPQGTLAKLAIGKNGQSNGAYNEYLWDGKIDDIRIYNRALSDEEISDLYDINPSGDQITVTLPNGGESWAAGSFHQIKWTDVIPNNEYVKIELYKGGIFDSEITASTPADGSKDWNIPPELSLGSDYKIKITSTDSSNVYDFSDADFTISDFTPQIVLTEPNGGEDLYSGHSHLITWIDNIPENVKIELFKGGIFNSVIISSTYSDGSKDWDIPLELTPASDYRIKITSVENSEVYGISDANFTITSGMPVELVSFEAIASLDRVSLNWQTATETNSYGFDIERQVNDNEWASIGFIEGSGTSNSPKQYSFIDSNPFGGSKFFYRLKQIDYDGYFEYSDVVEVELQPEQYTLYQNYPNPFNPSTTIKFSLPEDVRVRINIYNSLGELVAEVINKEYEAGYHKVKFGGTNIPSGIYFYRIIAGEFIETKKMILMK